MRDRDRAVWMIYINWRGEMERRHILPSVDGMRFGTSPWHQEPGWLLEAYDLERLVWRTFALSGVRAWAATEGGLPGDMVEAANMLAEVREGLAHAKTAPADVDRFGTTADQLRAQLNANCLQRDGLTLRVKALEAEVARLRHWLRDIANLPDETLVVPMEVNSERAFRTGVKEAALRASLALDGQGENNG